MNGRFIFAMFSLTSNSGGARFPISANISFWRFALNRGSCSADVPR